MSGWRYPWAWRNCVGAWCPSRDRFRGSSILTDQSTVHNNGTLTNMDPPTDWILSPGAGGGYALDFDGSNDEVICGTGVYPSGGELTVSGWWNSRSWGLDTLIRKGTLAGDSTSTFALYYFSSTGWRWFVVDGSHVLTLINYLETPATNTWYHLVGTCGGGTVKLYRNGAEVASSAQTTGVKASTHSTVIGYDPTYGYRHDGLIDDIRLYNRALTPSEIALLYRLGRGGAYAIEYVPIGKAGVAPATRNDNLLLLGVS